MKRVSSKQAIAHSITKEVKEKVWDRDGGQCVFCGTCYNVAPEAHFIPRSKGGLGIEENVLTLCRRCHNRYDFGPRYDREAMREFFEDYLEDCYPEWDETKLIYHKEGL